MRLTYKSGTFLCSARILHVNNIIVDRSIIQAPDDVKSDACQDDITLAPREYLRLKVRPLGANFICVFGLTFERPDISSMSVQAGENGGTTEDTCRLISHVWEHNRHSNVNMLGSEGTARIA